MSVRNLKPKVEGRGGDLLVFHLVIVVEFFVACLPEHLTEYLTSVFVYKFRVIFLFGSLSLSLIVSCRIVLKGILLTRELVERRVVAIEYSLGRYYNVFPDHRH